MWKHTRKNRHMRIKLKRWSQQLVLAFPWERKVWGCLTNICEMNALKHSILPSAWRGTWWADCTSKSPKRKRAEQLSCEEWGSLYQNQIASFWIAVPLSKWRSYASASELCHSLQKRPKISHKTRGTLLLELAQTTSKSGSRCGWEKSIVLNLLT